uniref:Uncharacterized protein n=1 Tax=Sphaerodactylus townsendi TaxID=933632 RepID=A0ACB8EUN7_9SAUR
MASSHQSGLRFLPPPFHHPGWRSHPHPEFLAPRTSPSCLYASRRKDSAPSCLEFEAGKCPPGPRPEVSPLPGLERKEAAFSVRQGGPPPPNFASGALPQPGVTIFAPPPPCEELTSTAPNGNLLGGSPSPSDFAEKRNYQGSILLKPSYGQGESKGREEEEEEEEEEENFLPKAPSLDLPQRVGLGGVSFSIQVIRAADFWSVSLHKARQTMPERELRTEKVILNYCIISTFQDS